MTGNVYGDGVYFAVDASVSAKYSTCDTNGYRYMFACLVLTGEYTLGKSGIRAPPVKSVETQKWYDSVCDNLISPTMFIIFNDLQVYPTHLIIFRQRSVDCTVQPITWWKPLSSPSGIT